MNEQRQPCLISEYQHIQTMLLVMKDILGMMRLSHNIPGKSLNVYHLRSLSSIFDMECLSYSLTIRNAILLAGSHPPILNVSEQRGGTQCSSH